MHHESITVVGSKKGGATVILAMGQGKKAAKAIDEYLKTGQ